MYNEKGKQTYLHQLNLLEDKEPYAVALAKEIIDQESYNGWVNRETCVVALHLSSDEDLYRQTLTRIDDTETVGEAAASIERWVKEKHSILHHEPPNRITQPWLNMLADTGSLWRVDWQQIAAYFID